MLAFVFGLTIKVSMLYYKRQLFTVLILLIFMNNFIKHFSIICQLYILGINPAYSILNKLLICSILFAKILLQILHLCFINEIFLA